MIEYHWDKLQAWPVLLIILCLLQKHWAYFITLGLEIKWILQKTAEKSSNPWGIKVGGGLMRDF